MDRKRREWAKGGDDDDDSNDSDDSDGDRMLQEAIDMAIQNGKGWAPEQKEEYMKMILDDDYIPPIFCSSEEELRNTGLSEAFSSLKYDDDPAITMKLTKQRASKAFLDGKQNLAQNIQYYRTAINLYYETVHWATKIEPLEHRQQSTPTLDVKKDDDTPTKPNSSIREDTSTFEVYTENELNNIKSTLYSNSSLCHVQLKNWGYAKNDAERSLTFNDQNIKSIYRLALSYSMLREYIECGTTIDTGLDIDSKNKELLKLKKSCSTKINSARQAKQKRETQRSERIAKIKCIWKHCQNPTLSKISSTGDKIKLGRIALVASTNDSHDEDASCLESKWHHHFPHTGSIPKNIGNEWTWPCMFQYPSHNQSDFVKDFNENELLAMRMGEMYPELDEENFDGAIKETSMKWDYRNEFTCSNLAIYFECNEVTTTKNGIIHPEQVELLTDLSSTMKYYESSRALKGDEGPDIMKVVELLERKRLKKQRKQWKKQYNSLYNKPNPVDCIRIHPGMTLHEILIHPKMIVTNFIVTFIVIPENHPYHEIYLKQHPCIHILQPTQNPK
ncbi:hypothetical protein FRACYDRAFT_229304 [Fragilariopsis cylindrus CCMP1102]|uniref:Cns1/TTC4 wheel domain-containing protein n=1 Tax=Fragilariopsis cylindrus CCMP1102 TaxID=635003 RepID=A0A1E7EQ70_9STRA|nr:hypothetical protein FRACYDRAFT_229304 [Fragilariopsis cylindrus CCMP1102]|eukprot:OEU08112.1 hypothetical protein FRACYDRAFT_229304 [Fragilariopsis cylindrus CCMP1102]